MTSTVGDAPILRNVGAGTCLAWDTGNGTGVPVTQKACAAADQGEQVVFIGTGRLNVAGEADALIQNTAASLCLAADSAAAGNGKPVKQSTCKGSDRYQMWN